MRWRVHQQLAHTSRMVVDLQCLPFVAAQSWNVFVANAMNENDREQGNAGCDEVHGQPQYKSEDCMWSSRYRNSDSNVVLGCHILGSFLCKQKGVGRHRGHGQIGYFTAR